MFYTVQTGRWWGGAELRIYVRQLSLGLFWSAVAVVVLWLLSSASGDRFDSLLAVAATVSMAAIQVSWSATHIRTVRRRTARPAAQDYLRSPARDVFFAQQSAEWINALLLGAMPAGLGVEVYSMGSGDYLVRQSSPTRARVHVQMDLSGQTPVLHIRGHIPWWVGVDYGHCHALVLAVRDYLIENGASEGPEA